MYRLTDLGRPGTLNDSSTDHLASRWEWVGWARVTFGQVCESVERVA